jgi:hypothetical protein
MHYQVPCVVYYMGSNNEFAFAFERRVRTLAPCCEIHRFDPTVRETEEGKEAQGTIDQASFKERLLVWCGSGGAHD